MADAALICADSHFVEPPNMWAERLDRRFRERVPRAVRLEGKPGEYFVDYVARHLGKVPEIDRPKIVRDTAAKVFGLD